MPSVVVWGLRIGVALQLVQLTACASFQAVQTTARVGQGLQRHHEILGAAGANCVVALAYLGHDDGCAPMVNGDPGWRAVLDALIVYSNRLATLAEGAEVEPGDAAAELAGLRTAIDSDGATRASALGQALDGLVSALTAEARTETVRAFVRRVGPNADRIARLVSDQLTIELQRFSVRKQALCAALEQDDRWVIDEHDKQRFLARSSSADRLAHSRELARMIEQERRHQLAIADLQTFIRAHHTLLRELGRGDYDDAEAQQRVLDVLTAGAPAELSSKEITTCPRPQK